ncbi:hypothetical protein LCGC14_3005040 [marine sediment metagenome]|uniref:Ammonium transporter AmtB-like domain-containing protein n=1 Tax=marine sediment metagenome TaxID=412755 RepID=A0A0F8WZW1_9ZZZZ
MEPTVTDAFSRIDTLWVVMAGILVFFMQAGFMFLEIGFSRMKNVGTVVAKVIVNLSVAAIFYWAVGFALAFGATQTPEAGETAGWFAGNAGFFLHHLGEINLPALSFSDAHPGSKFFFQFLGPRLDMGSLDQRFCQFELSLFEIRKRLSFKKFLRFQHAVFT